MYKINHKAVILTIVILLVLGGGWNMAAPLTIGSGEGGVGFLISFLAAVVCYVYFNAWLLLKTRFITFLDSMLLIMGIWLFSVLPNIFFMQTVLALPLDKLVYLLTFGALSGLITAFVLSIWRTSRSIFKT